MQTPLAMESSRPVEKLLNGLGRWDLADQWHRIRHLRSEDQEVLARAFSNSQIESKLWLIDILRATLPNRAYNVCIVGGWVGALARLMHWRMPELLGRVVLVDEDPETLELASKLNLDLIQAKKLELVQADANDYPYSYNFHLVLNCAVEHFTQDRWFENIPRGRLVAMQASDANYEPDHHNCVYDLPELHNRYPLDVTLYKGTLEFPRAKRLMMIGRK